MHGALEIKAIISTVCLAFIKNIVLHSFMKYIRP